MYHLISNGVKFLKLAKLTTPTGKSLFHFWSKHDFILHIASEAHPGPLSSEYRWLIPWVLTGQDVKLTTHPQPMIK
jgi:hypothetical protein